MHVSWDLLCTVIVVFSWRYCLKGSGDNGGQVVPVVDIEGASNKERPLDLLQNESFLPTDIVETRQADFTSFIKMDDNISFGALSPPKKRVPVFISVIGDDLLDDGDKQDDIDSD